MPAAHVGNSLEGRAPRSISWHPQAEPTVGSSAVVVVHVDAKDALEVSRFKINSQSRHSERAVRTRRSAKALALGARSGVRMTRTPSAANTTSKEPANLASRARTRH